MTGETRLHLIDTSALARAHDRRIARIIGELIVDRVAATCVTLDLEAGYSGRGHTDVLTIAQRRRDRYRTLPITEEIADRARTVQQRMAARGHHRAAGIVDLITAATAERYDAILLHYHSDFEHIAAVTGQTQAWIVPRGTAD